MKNLLELASIILIAVVYTTKDKKVVETTATSVRSFPYQWCLN